MTSNHDSAGRPMVAVTGIGVITSLGAGKTENWKNLTAGKSGIKNITRFATDGLRTRFAGTVDFVPGRAAVAAGAVGAAGRTGGRGSRRPIRDRQPRRLSGPAVPRRPAGRNRMGAAPRSRGRLRRQRQRQLRRPHPHRRDRQFKPIHERFHVRLGRRPPRRPVRHQGLADLAVDRLRLGRDRDPARRRGDPPRRDRARRSASAPTARSIRNR